MLTKPIEMPCGKPAHVGTGNDVLDSCPDIPWEGHFLRGNVPMYKCIAHCLSATAGEWTNAFATMRSD